MTDDNRLPEEGFVRLKQILKVFPVCKSDWWEGVKSGEYPPSHKLGPRKTGWCVQELREFFKRIKAKGQQQQ